MRNANNLAGGFLLGSIAANAEMMLLLFCDEQIGFNGA